MELSLNHCFGGNSLSMYRWMEELKRQCQKFQNAGGFGHFTLCFCKPEKERGRKSTENMRVDSIRETNGDDKAGTENLGRRGC